MHYTGSIDLPDNPEADGVGELEVMRLRNKINKIGGNVNQIVKNSNPHRYKEENKWN